MGNKNFAVGLFVAIALTAFVTGTLWLTGKQGSEPTLEYSMYFDKDVGGLMLGGPVFYLGVEVGTVTDMKIIPGDPMRVRVDARVLKSAPVDTGTYASLSFQGITGVSVVKLYADPGKHEPIRKDENQRLVIKVRDAGFTALLNRAPSIVDQLDSVLQQVNHILGEENREFIRTMLGDISDVTSALAAKQDEIGEIPVLLNSAIRELQSSLAEIKSLVGEAQPGLSSTVANLDQATRNLVDITARFETWAAANDTDMNAFMGDGLGQVPALVSDARATLREIEKLVTELRENPSRLIREPREDAVEVER